MRSPSIEYFHAKIEKSIRLVQSYTENDVMEFVIKTCRLKPYDYLFGDGNNKTVLYRWWIDEFGSSLHILDNKKISITYNDLHLDREKIISTDMYYGLSIDRVVKISKLAYLCAGKDEDLYQDCYLLNLLGVDDHLRSYLYWFGGWQQVSPLLMGMKHLKLLASNLDTNYFRQLSNSENSPLPCILPSACITYLPVSGGFLDLVKSQYEPLLLIFGEIK